MSEEDKQGTRRRLAVDRQALSSPSTVYSHLKGGEMGMLDADNEELGTFSPVKLRHHLSVSNLYDNDSSDSPAESDKVGMGKPKLSRQASVMTSAMGMIHFDTEIGQDHMPVWIVAFLHFQNKPDKALVKAVAKDRIFTIPRFRCRIVENKQDKTAWLEELGLEAMKASDYVEIVEQSEPWSQETIDTYVSGMWSRGFAKNLAPWKLVVVNETDKGDSIIIVAVDHALADGTAAIATLLACLDEPCEGDNNAEKGNKGNKAVLQKRSSPSVSPICRVKALLNGVKVGLFAAVLPGDPA
eukprot:g285.t1